MNWSLKISRSAGRDEIVFGVVFRGNGDTNVVELTSAFDRRSAMCVTLGGGAVFHLTYYISNGSIALFCIGRMPGCLESFHLVGVR